MRKFLVIFYLYLFSNAALQAQEDTIPQLEPKVPSTPNTVSLAQGGLIPQLAPNAPSTAELGSFGAIPVGLFTGTAQFTIPIFELKTNNLTVPIAINYSSNGLKVDKVASWVGFDWSLEAGGVITRKINGPADEVEPLTDYPNAAQLNPDNLYDYLTSILNSANVENDEYDFNFCGKSGKFFFDKNWKALSVPNNGEFKIEKSLIGFTITITDNNGVVYTFLPMEYSDYVNQQSPDLQPVPIAWFLTQITHPYGDIINFFYKSQSYNPTYRTGVTQSCAFGTQLTYFHSGNAGPFIESVCGDGLAYFLNSTVSTTHLESIVANSTGKVIFESSDDRVDINTEYKLNKIKIETSDNNIIKIINFNYDFVFATNGGNYVGSVLSGSDVQYRMFLNNVLINDRFNNSINKYSFQYNNLNNLPLRLSPSQDHWGYYNGKTNNCLFPTDLPILSFYPSLPIGGNHSSREPDGNYSQYGMLNQITYPTGGYTLLEYEPNKIGSIEYGGCRVSRTLDFKAAGSDTIIKKYFYTTRDDLSNSKGTVFTNSGNYFKTFNRWSSSDGNTAEDCSFASVQSNSQFGLYMSGCYHITYPCVLISYGNHFENGGEEHTFLSIPDEYSNALGCHTSGSTLIMRTTNSGWASGTKLSETIFKMDGSGNTIPLKNVVYSYNTNENRDLTNVNCLALSWSQNIQPVPSTEYDLLPNYNARNYSICSRWLPLMSTTTTTYDENGQNAAVVVESFTYANQNHNKLVTTKNVVLSNGKTSITKYKYVPDYDLVVNTGCQPVDACLTTDTRPLYYLCLYNQISNPIEEQSLVYDGTTYKLISGKLTRYKMSNNVVVPDNILISNLTSPSDDITISSLQSNSTLVYHSSYKPEVIFDLYSDKSQPTQYHKVNDTYSSVIWDYSGHNPTAMVKNAVLADVAYTSFEDSEPGGWTLVSTSTTKGMSFTGKRYYTLSNGNISKNINSGLVYSLTYWTKNAAAYSISGTMSGYPVKGNTINGWTFFEHRITGSPQINLSGSSDIDELRLYPVDAQMTTYTYDPLIGMTTQTDPNNVVTYYEYDSFGRLMLIKDQYGNILKTYDYHYKQ